MKVCSLRFCLPEKKIEGNSYVLSEREWLMEKILLWYLLVSSEKLRLGSWYCMINMDLHFSMKIRIHSKWVYVDTGGSWPASYVGPWEEWGHRSWSEANGVKEKNKSMRRVFQTWAYIIQGYFWTLTVKNNMEKDEH